MNHIDLNLTNFSYYAFNPFSQDLSSSDQKVALIATILLGVFTPVIGHLICGICYLINKEKIDSLRTSNNSINEMKNQNFQIAAERAKIEAKTDKIKADTAARLAHLPKKSQDQVNLELELKKQKLEKEKQETGKICNEFVKIFG